MKKGDKVRVIRCENFPILVGLEGTLEKKTLYNKRVFFLIKATNDGPAMRGEKNRVVKAWRVGNTTRRLEGEIIKI